MLPAAWMSMRFRIRPNFAAILAAHASSKCPG
jgi:hypothetical protein